MTCGVLDSCLMSSEHSKAEGQSQEKVQQSGNMGNMSTTRRPPPAPLGAAPGGTQHRQGDPGKPCMQPVLSGSCAELLAWLSPGLLSIIREIPPRPSHTPHTLPPHTPQIRRAPKKPISHVSGNVPEAERVSVVSQLPWAHGGPWPRPLHSLLLSPHLDLSPPRRRLLASPAPGGFSEAKFSLDAVQLMLIIQVSGGD